MMQEDMYADLIQILMEEYGYTLEKAMDIYYSSNLAEMIHNGVEGIQYLDYKVLAQILQETEPERFQ